MGGAHAQKAESSENTEILIKEYEEGDEEF